MREAARRRIAIGAAALILVGCSLFVESSNLTGAASGPPEDDAGKAADATSDAAAPADGSVVDGPLVVGDADAGREPGLVGEWRFEDEGNVAKDTSGRGRDGQLTGNAAMTSGGVSGAGVVLMGASDAVLIQGWVDAAFPRTGALSMWFKQALPDSSTGSVGVFDNWDDTRDHVFVRRPNDMGQTFQVSFQRGDAAPYPVSANFPSPADKWTHVAVTWQEDARIGVVYVDGVEVRRGSYYGGPFVPSRQIMRLGSGFVGMIDEVRLYDRVLTAPEVLALAQ